MKFLNSFSTGFWTLVGLCLFLAVLGFIIYRLSKQPDQQQIKQNGVIKSPNSNKQSLLTRLLLILNDYPIVTMVIISNLITVALIHIINTEQGENFYSLMRTPIFVTGILTIFSGWLKKIDNSRLFGKFAPNKIEKFILKVQVYILGFAIILTEIFFVYNPVYTYLVARDQLKIQQRTEILKEQQQTEEDSDIVNIAKIRQQARNELINEGLIVDGWFGYLSKKVLIHLGLIGALMFLIDKLARAKQFNVLLAAIAGEYKTEHELLGSGQGIGFRLLQSLPRVLMLQTLSEIFDNNSFRLIHEESDDQFIVILSTEAIAQLGTSEKVLKQYALAVGELQ